MAVDSRNRRASCLLVGFACSRVWPDPDGSLATEPDREHMTYLYRLTADAQDRRSRSIAALTRRRRKVRC